MLSELWSNTNSRFYITRPEFARYYKNLYHFLVVIPPVSCKSTFTVFAGQYFYVGVVIVVNIVFVCLLFRGSHSPIKNIKCTSSRATSSNSFTEAGRVVTTGLFRSNFLSYGGSRRILTIQWDNVKKKPNV